MSGHVLREKERVVFKTIFASPYSVWPSIDEEVQRQVLDCFIATVASFSNIQSLKPFLALGINQVTKSLERLELDFVLVCRDDIVPPILVHHIPMQCLVSNCSCICMLRNSSQDISSALKAPSVVKIVGVKKNIMHESFRPLIALLSTIRTLSISLPSNLQHFLQTYHNVNLNVVSIRSSKNAKKQKTKEQLE